MLLFTKMENEKVIVDNVHELFEWYCGRTVLNLGEAIRTEFGIDIHEKEDELHVNKGRDISGRYLKISFSVPKTSVDRNGIFLNCIEELVAEGQKGINSCVSVKSFRQHINYESTNKTWDNLCPDVDDILITVYFPRDIDVSIKQLYDAVQAAKEEPETPLERSCFP